MKLNSLMLLIAAVIAICAMSVVPGNSAPIMCLPHDRMVASLINKYHERRIGWGQINDQKFMEFFASTRGTWTIIVTNTKGVACIRNSGRDFSRSGEWTARET